VELSQLKVARCRDLSAPVRQPLCIARVGVSDDSNLRAQGDLPCRKMQHYARRPSVAGAIESMTWVTFMIGLETLPEPHDNRIILAIVGSC